MTCAVYDLASSRVVASLRGHAGSVKTAVWFDPSASLRLIAHESRADVPRTEQTSS